MNFLKNKYFPYIFSFVLLIPSVVWIFMDNHVWPWDQAWYGEVSVDLYYKLTHSFFEWPKAMASAFGVKAPAIAWLGQFFIPLAKITGSIDRSLLLSVILAQFLSLVLIYKIIFSLTDKKIIAFLGVLTMASASLFVGMGHQYFVESLQLLAVTSFIFILVNIKKWNRYEIILSLLLIMPFLMIIKITSPLYIIFPLFLIILYLFKMSEKITARKYFKEKKHITYYVLAIFFFSSVIAWYVINWSSIYQFMQLASSGSAAELYGTKSPLFQKFTLWLSFFQRSFFIPVVLYFIFFILSAYLFQYIFFKKHKLLELPTFISISSSMLVLVAFSFQINEETRYLLPLLPYIIMLICWLLYKINSKWINIIAVAVFSFQFIYVNGFALGLIKGNPQNISSWTTVVHKNGDQKNEMRSIIVQTCKPESANRINVVGVEFPWLNANSAEYYATQNKLTSNFQCYYTSLGYAENNVDKAINRVKNLIKPPYFITVSGDSFPAVDAFNAVSISVAESIENDKSFVEQEFSKSKSIRIFENKTIISN